MAPFLGRCSEIEVGLGVGWSWEWEGVATSIAVVWLAPPPLSRLHWRSVAVGSAVSPALGLAVSPVAVYASDRGSPCGRRPPLTGPQADRGQTKTAPAAGTGGRWRLSAGRARMNGRGGLAGQGGGERDGAGGSGSALSSVVAGGRVMSARRQATEAETGRVENGTQTDSTIWVNYTASRVSVTDVTAILNDSAPCWVTHWSRLPNVEKLSVLVPSSLVRLPRSWVHVLSVGADN